MFYYDMRLEIAILGITSFFIYNAYNDGKYTKMLLTFKKYYKMLFYVFLGIGVYLLLKKNPTQGKHLLIQANNYVKYMPIDTNTRNLINPIIDFTAMATSTQSNESKDYPHFAKSSSNNRILNSGKHSSKRCVSETKKKYVASRQNWKCNECDNQLDHTFEIDHKVRLEYGGGNDVQNLVALCRNCHGIKTANENM